MTAPSAAVLAWIRVRESGWREEGISKNQVSMLSMSILPMCCWGLLSKALGHTLPLCHVHFLSSYTGWTRQNPHCPKFRFSLTGWEFLTWNPAGCLTLTAWVSMNSTSSSATTPTDQSFISFHAYIYTHRNKKTAKRLAAAILASSCSTHTICCHVPGPFNRETSSSRAKEAPSAVSQGRKHLGLAAKALARGWMQWTIPSAKHLS